jgi:5,10-methylenetetrahydromethanopterin reductase
LTKLGLSLGLSPRESISRFSNLLQLADRNGVDAAWVVDSQLAMKDAYIALGIVARETEHLKIGPGVTNLITRHETVVANAMNTVEDVAPGRALVGVGAGDSAVFPLGLKPSPVADLRGGIRRLRALLAGEAVAFAPGLEPKALSFHPALRPPIYLAGSQPRMLKLAGEVADGVIIMGPSDPDTVRMQLAHVDEGARAAGRDPQDVVRDLWVTISIGNDDSCVADVKSWASAQARWLTSWKHVPDSLERFRGEMESAARDYDFSAHLSLRADHADVISDDFARVLAVSGTPEQCAGRLVELARTGVERITLSLLSGGREQRLESIVKVWADVAARLERRPAATSEAVR